MASAYSGQVALCTSVSAPPPHAQPSSNDAENAVTSTTLSTYVPPKRLWSTKRGDEKGGGGIAVYKISSVSLMAHVSWLFYASPCSLFVFLLPGTGTSKLSSSFSLYVYILHF